MFADQENLAPEKDPREDIVLTNVSTQMTSAGLVLQGVQGKHAVFSANNNDLIIENMQVTMFGEDKSTKSITRADLGEVYFADDSKRGVGRKDMKFSGNVLYRTPQKNNTTTDSLRIITEMVLWKEAQKKFIGPTNYTMLLYPKGKAPIKQTGKGFEATEELNRFVVKAGTLTTDMNSERVDRALLLQQFDEWRNQADSQLGQPINIPVTIPPVGQ